MVGCASALALSRRGARVALLEAEADPGLAASGTNSGILHTGFDSKPGELETALILRSAAVRLEVLDVLGVQALLCGAVLTGDAGAIRQLARNAVTNGVPVILSDGRLEVPGEAVTDPVAYTLALAAAAREHGAELHTGAPVVAMDADPEGVTVTCAGGATVRTAVVVNCAGLRADEVARLLGDDGFEVYPRKGDFLVFDVTPPDQILLPVPDRGTKGVLVFPTVDGKTVAGPTAVDQRNKDDWSARPEARAELIPKASAMYPPLADADPVFAYAGLRPAGRGVNYVVGISPACGRLVNAAAIRSTGLTASLGIGERVAELAGEAGLELGPEEPLRRGEPIRYDGPWWRRTAERRAVAA